MGFDHFFREKMKFIKKTSDFQREKPENQVGIIKSMNEPHPMFFGIGSGISL